MLHVEPIPVGKACLDWLLGGGAVSTVELPVLMNTLKDKFRESNHCMFYESIL